MAPLPHILNRRHYLWVTREQLGSTVKVPTGTGDVMVRVPTSFEPGTSLRLAGHGRRIFRWQGDLYLRLLLNEGPAILGDLWLGRNQAATGGVLGWGTKPSHSIKVPKALPDGTTLRLARLGSRPRVPWRAPKAEIRRGDLLLKVRIFDEEFAPSIVEVDDLDLDLLEIENWVYRQMDWVRADLGRRLPTHQVSATAVADRFNVEGWRGIASLLVGHFGLEGKTVYFAEDATISVPGQCVTHASTSYGKTSCAYRIKIKPEFLINPFAVAAILAHELCHVVVFEWLTADLVARLGRKLSEKEILEEERLVDLLVFMFGLGQFQVRVAEMNRSTLGYFDQRNFNRMLRIAQKKVQIAGGAFGIASTSGRAHTIAPNRP